MSTTYIYKFHEAEDLIFPYVPIRITNPDDNAFMVTFGLLDTGASNCVFPKWVVDATNHELKGEGVESKLNQGVGSDKVTTWKHPFIIELMDPIDTSKSVWKSNKIHVDCLDHDYAPVLLGFRNFLINFKITFDYRRKRIIIEVP